MDLATSWWGRNPRPSCGPPLCCYGAPVQSTERRAAAWCPREGRQGVGHFLAVMTSSAWLWAFARGQLVALSLVGLRVRKAAQEGPLPPVPRVPTTVEEWVIPRRPNCLGPLHPSSLIHSRAQDKLGTS